MDTSKYKDLFLKETNDHLSGIEEGLLSLESNPTDASLPAAINTLFRHYHSIKGMCASMGYMNLKNFAHAQEDLLDRLRSSGEGPAADMVSVLLSSLDLMRDIVQGVEDNDPAEVDTSALITTIKELTEGGAAATAAPPAATPPGAQDTTKASAPAVAATGPSVQPAPSQRLKLSKVMKVESSVFDDLLRITGDLLMALSELRSIAQTSTSLDLKNGVHRLGKTIEELHSGILDARMLPFSSLAENLPRIVRDVAKKSGKEVDFKVEGAQISLDRSILEGMGDPLVHLIRNSVDHGIETPEEREAAGKPRKGTITLRATGKKDHAVIEVHDNGRGIDAGRLKEKAISRGMPEDEARALSDNDALMLVCTPGLSTKESVTDVSGRGVGMDVVKSVIEEIGGTLSIDSAPGKYTKMTMELPRASSIIKMLLVSIAGEVVGIPLTKVDKVMEMEADVKRAMSLNGGIMFMGKKLPSIKLREVFGIKGEVKDDLSTLVLVQMDGTEPDGTNKLVTIEVDRLIDEIDAYIRPLMPPLSKLSCASGFTILGDGRPVFILDVGQVTKGVGA